MRISILFTVLLPDNCACKENPSQTEEKVFLQAQHCVGKLLGMFMVHVCLLKNLSVCSSAVFSRTRQGESP